MAGHRAYLDPARWTVLDVSQVSYIVQIDQDCRLRQTKIQHWYQALSASQDLGIVTMFSQVG